MSMLCEAPPSPTEPSRSVLPISVIIAAKNEAHNLPRCLESLSGVAEVFVIDSQSADGTAEIASSCGAVVAQFHYRGGWPKKRQWALDTLPLTCDWVLLIDADEAMTPELRNEICATIQKTDADGFYIALDIIFLGRRLRYSGASFYKLCLFRRGKGRFECRSENQDGSMCDMEVHEHVMVDGTVGKLRNRLLHHNVESMERYIQKHNQYSNWEAQVLVESGAKNDQQLRPALFGSQAQRRRWLRKRLFWMPGSPLLFFLYKYVLRFGFLDGVPGLIHCTFQAVQFFHIKAKVYEIKHAPPRSEQVRLVSQSLALKN